MIFCLDNDKNSREMISYGAENCGMVCHSFSNTDTFFHALADRLPHLILLDIQLDGRDGFDVLRQLKTDPHTSHTPIIIVSSKAEEFDKIMALDSGADDFVAKPFGVLELLSRIRAVLRRSRNEEFDLLRLGELVLNKMSHRVFVGENEIFLTNREYQLLEYLMDNEGVLLSREQLLHRVWGFDFQVETRTVDVHIRYLRQKLGRTGALIETVRGVGYRIGRTDER